MFPGHALALHACNRRSALDLGYQIYRLPTAAVYGVTAALDGGGAPSRRRVFVGPCGCCHLGDGDDDDDDASCWQLMRERGRDSDMVVTSVVKD